MAHLDKLNITNRVIRAVKLRHKVKTIQYRRTKLIANIEEQIELVNLASADKPLQLQRKRGHTVTTVKPRIWWSTEHDGMVFTQIRYNKIILNLDGRGNSIEVGRLRSLPKVYRTVIKATEAGELDRVLESASQKSHG